RRASRPHTRSACGGAATMNTTPDESTHRAIQRRLRAIATRGKTDLLVRTDHVAVGDAVRVGNDVHNLFDREGAATWFSTRTVRLSPFCTVTVWEPVQPCEVWG